MVAKILRVLGGLIAGCATAVFFVAIAWYIRGEDGAVMAHVMNMDDGDDNGADGVELD
ncbi:MAG: hypothetical protein HOC23_08435 [Halieaceae bacterium]|jgi:hypothetical protein|nr:hypothetical protein [Halieaceae bacterium]